MIEMTHAEKLDLLTRINDARRRGDDVEASKLSRLIPLVPHLAMAAKDILGADYVRNSGYDLTLAEERYWLNR